MRKFGFNGRLPIKLTDAATVTVDASKGHVFTLETSGGAGRTIDGPTGGYDGQIIEIRCKNTHGSLAITHTLDVAGADSFRFPAGFNSLNDIPAGGVQAICAQYHLGDTKWDVLGDSLGATNIAAGSTKQVQYNNAGAQAGAANVEIESDNLLLKTVTDPAAPTAAIIPYSKLVAGRHSPYVQTPRKPLPLQTGLECCSQFIIKIASGTTAPNVLGGTLTTAATMSLQQTIASANPWLATARKRFQTSTTAGNQTGMRTAYTQWFRGNAAGFGGFYFRAKFGHQLNLNGGQMFMGLCASTAVLSATAGSVAALLNMCGMGYDTTDANTGNWFFYRNDGSGTATKVDLGGTNALRSNVSHGYELTMYLAPNGSDLFVTIVNLHNGAVVLDTSYNTDLPAVNTGLAFKAETNNGAVASAQNIEIANVYIESEY